MTVQRKCKREQSQACLNFAECSLSSNTVQRYKKNRQNAIVVPNHVHPCPESRAFLPHIHSLPPNLTAINLMAIKLNVKSVNIIWHVLPFQLRPDAVGATSRRIARCVRTWLAARRHAVLGASGAQLLAMWVSWWIGGKAKM